MLSEKMLDALNKQINEELASAYIYRSMAAYFHNQNLDGFASWMHTQTEEEDEHAMKIFHYIYERGGHVTLTTITAPPTTWDSPLAAFEAAYHHERHISQCIDDLVNLAIDEKDHATFNFLQWFVEEQVEEEASADGVVQKLRLIGDNTSGLFMLDRQLAQRRPE